MLCLSFCTPPKATIDPVEEELIEISELIRYYPKKQLARLDSLKAFAMDNDTIHYLGHIHTIYGFYNYINYNIDEALDNFNNAIIWFTEKESEEYGVWNAKCYLGLGLIAENVKNMQRAKFNYLKAISYIHPEDSYEDYGIATIGIGRINRLLNEPYKERIQSGVLICAKSSHLPYRLYARYINISYFHKSHLEDSLNVIANKYKENLLFSRASGAYFQIASHFKIEKKQFSKALNYSDSALLYINKASNRKHNLPTCYLEKASIILHQYKLNEAKEQLLYALELYKKYEQHNNQFLVYNYLHQLEKRFGSADLAYEYLQKDIDLRINSLYKQNVWQIRILEINETVSELEQEIASLNHRKKILTFSLLFISVILILIIYYVTQNLKRKSKAQRLQVEEDKQELQNLLLLAQEKKEFVHRLNEITEDKIELHSTNVNHANRFDFCYSELILKLRNNFPALNETDIKYAVMFGLGLENTLIAQIQGVNIASIRKSRQRIRNKLNLDIETKIDDFFKQFISKKF